MTIDFTGKIALITGAASGIGRASAIEFARLGAVVAAADLANVSETARTITESGGTAEPFICDVSDEPQVETLIPEIVNKYGALDIAFNCAGIGPDGVRFPYSELTDTSAADWLKIIGVNLTGTFYCLKHELKQMRKQGFGSIVNTSSTGGDRFAPGFNAYGPSKAGVIALTEMAANENAKLGIRVNCVCPGPTYGTQMMNNSLESDLGMEQILTGSVIPMGKFGRMEDVAAAVIWLSSELAAHTTGHALFVDGGMHVKP
jgi:NAD(P)-dependent dehydrogenase (short-subunit alcohol dehydrogenase family)